VSIAHSFSSRLQRGLQGMLRMGASSGIRTRLLLLVLALLLPFLIYVLIGAQREADAEREHARRQVLAVAQLTAARLDDQVNNIYQLLAKTSQLFAKFPFKVMFTDYDANIQESVKLNSSYVEGGTIYANIKGYGKARCVNYVGCQTKIIHWGEEKILKHFPNDSSKKQHHLDFLLGLGKNKECPGIGTLNLPKVRRGRLTCSTSNWSWSPRFRGASRRR